MRSLFLRDSEVVLAFGASSQLLYVEVALILSNHPEFVVAVSAYRSHTRARRRLSPFFSSREEIQDNLAPIFARSFLVNLVILLFSHESFQHTDHRNCCNQCQHKRQVI